MRGLVIILVLFASVALFGCSQEESKPAAPQSSTPPAKTVEPAKIVGQAEKVVEQTQEKVAQVADQAKEQVAKVEQKAGAMVASAKAALESGEAVYSKACVSCHKLGIAGAPKTGDKDAWAPLIGSGMDTLVNNAINGKGKMPAKGGNASLTDAQVRAAVEYMTEQSK